MNLDRSQISLVSPGRVVGTMLVAAFAGWYAGVLLGPILGTEGTAIFNASPTLLAARRQLMDLSFLFDIPVLGLFFQLMGWLVDVVVLFAPSIIGSATPITFAALTGVLCERSGVVNIGIEGTMLVTFDAATGVMEAEISGSRTRTDCAFLPRLRP